MTQKRAWDLVRAFKLQSCNAYFYEKTVVLFEVTSLKAFFSDGINTLYLIVFLGHCSFTSSAYLCLFLSSLSAPHQAVSLAAVLAASQILRSL